MGWMKDQSEYTPEFFSKLIKLQCYLPRRQRWRQNATPDDWLYKIWFGETNTEDGREACDPPIETMDARHARRKGMTA
jgi:hypothetical protein